MLRKTGKKRGAARLGVEALEGRALMATGFTLVDTLNAKDTLDIDRLSLIQGIESLRANNAAELQTVISNGAAATQAYGSQYASLQTQYAAAVAAGDQTSAASIRQTEKLVLTTGSNVRLAMRKATAVADAVDHQLVQDENQANATFGHAVNSLNGGSNPFNLVTPVTNAFTKIGQNAQTQANNGTNALSAINTSITG